MTKPAASVEIALRIRARWSHPSELLERLPAGVRLSPERLTLPDGAEVEFAAVEADEEFAGIFRSSLRNPATDDELATVDDYTVNALLCGPGGSLEAARTMMQAAAALVRAGGAGVFIDNCALAHGGQNWLDMTDDGGADALTFAFVGIVGGRDEAYTMGMHVLGLRDVVMKRRDAEADDFGIIDVLRYMAESDRPIDDRHVLADLNGPRYQVFAEAAPADEPGGPMHNPFGRLRIVSLRDIAETN